MDKLHCYVPLHHFDVVSDNLIESELKLKKYDKNSNKIHTTKAGFKPLPQVIDSSSDML